jgi:hypothetical protein
VKLRIWKSLTFFIGLILFVAAFGVILLAGSVFNPPPYRIVIALQNIDPYTTLTRDLVAVDEQTMNQRVASRLVHEGEIDSYLGGMVLETIHAGEPLRRSAVASDDNPAAVHRLSLALTNPDIVAAVVPVSPKVIPDNVTAGDYVNVTMGMEGNVRQLRGPRWGEEAEADRWALEPTATPPVEGVLSLTRTQALPLGEELSEVAPPLDKIVLPQVEVINVTRERIPNPNYGMGFGGEEAAAEPAFLEGDIECVTLLVPKTAEELLYFAVDNGTLHLSVVPHAAVVEGPSPSGGVLWEDVVRFFQEERLRAWGLITTVVTTTQPLSLTAPITAGAEITEVLTSAPPATAVPSEAAASPEEGETSAEPPARGGKLSQYLVPVLIGGGLVLGLATGGLILMRGRER